MSAKTPRYPSSEARSHRRSVTMVAISLSCLLMQTCIRNGTTTPPALPMDESFPGFQEPGPMGYASESEYHLQEGLNAVQEGDYDTAYYHFHGYTRINPDDGIGYILCGQARLRSGQCGDALYYYEKAARAGSQDRRIMSGVAHCRRVELESAVKGLGEASPDEEKSVIKTYEEFRKAIMERDWNTVARTSSLYDLVANVGFVPYDTKTFEKSLDAYIYILSLDATTQYLDYLEPGQVVLGDDTARLALEGLQGELKDSVYFEKQDGQWEIVLFPASFAGGSP